MASAVAWVVRIVGSVIKVAGSKLAQKAVLVAAKNGVKHAVLKAAVAVARKAAFQLAAAAAVTAIFKPDIGGASGRPIQFTADANSPIPLIMGRMATAGSIVRRTLSNAVGAGVSYEVFFGVLTLAGDAGPVEEIEAFFANGFELQFDPGTAQPSLGPNLYYQSVMWQYTRLGASTDSAMTFSHVNPSDWTTAHKMTGYCAFEWVLKDGGEYLAGEPPPLWVIKGASVYDPRQDDTYPGGAGDQRADDPTTWTDMAAKYNPYLQALAWARGWRNNGILCLGAGLPDAGIDFEDFVQGANVADDNGWTIGGIVYSDDPKFTVLEQILRAGGGKPITGAKLGCTVQTPRVSIATITGADIDGFPSISTVRGWRESFNSVTVKCLQEDMGWKSVPVGRLEIEDWVTADGEARSEEIDFPFVQDPVQAAQLAVYDAGESREGGPFVLPLRPYFIGLEAGDCISLEEPAFGFTDPVKLVVSRRTREPMTGSRVVTAWTETDAKHTLALAATLTPTLPGAPPPVIPPARAIILTSYVMPTAILTATDAGTTATITIASHTRRYTDRDAAVTGGTVTGLDFDTRYAIYYDDDARAGGAVTYVATEVMADAISSADYPGRHLVGVITTPVDGGADTSSGGARPPGWDPDIPLGDAA